MKTSIAAFFLALATAFSGNVHASLLEKINALPVSRLEFGSFRLEVALDEIKDWPFPFEGANVSYHVDPDRIDILVAVKIAPDEPFREACAKTLGRVRKLLYVDADGHARMGRSSLISYYLPPKLGNVHEIALRALDTRTQVRVNVVRRGSCHAALIKAPITYKPLPPH